MYPYEIHAHEPMRCTPIKYRPMKHMSVRCTPTWCITIKYIP
jgi:hypothetical protein